MIDIVEQIATFTPLGIRFWDPVYDGQIRDALRVTARPENGGGPTVRAYTTASSVYVFNRLPGLRSLEHREPNSEFDSSPPARRRFHVEIEDLRRRYLPVAFGIDLPLPYSGVFLDGAAASPFEPSPKGFHLYSAPTRKAPRWMGVVRGELAVSGANRRAAHAVVRVALPEGRIWHGMADSRGRFVVILPYPTISGGFGSSPPVAGGGALSTQTWTVTLEVLYEPGRLEALPETRVPEYRSIFQQGPATIWPVPQSEGGNEVAELTATLEFGRELILKTAGLSQLLVSPAGSSP